MPPKIQNPISDSLLEEIFRNLEAISNQVNNLSKDLRDSEVDFGTVKTELRILIENFKEISDAIWSSSQGSMMTRLALLEQDLANLKSRIVEKEREFRDSNPRISLLEEAIESQKYQAKVEQQVHHAQQTHQTTLAVTDKSGSWQMRTTLISSLAAVIVAIITFAMHFYK